jgi:transcription antitermination factor NusG
MVHFAGEPAIVPDFVIDTIRKEIVQRNASTTEETHSFRRGDVVRIVRGPFADLLAVFDDLMDGNTRSQVFIDFLGRLCRAKVDLNDLEKVLPHTAQQFTPLPRRSRGRGRPINLDKSGQ